MFNNASIHFGVTTFLKYVRNLLFLNILPLYIPILLALYSTLPLISQTYTRKHNTMNGTETFYIPMEPFDSKQIFEKCSLRSITCDLRENNFLDWVFAWKYQLKLDSKEYTRDPFLLGGIKKHRVL